MNKTQQQATKTLKTTKDAVEQLRSVLREEMVHCRIANSRRCLYRTIAAWRMVFGDELLPEDWGDWAH